MKKLIFCSAAAAVLLGLAGQARAAVAETRQNLRTAFVGESNAAHRYDLFARQADAEGHTEAARLLRAAARSESVHRERHRAALKRLGGDTTDPVLETVNPGATAENLRAAIAGESHERDVMYPAFVATAKAEDAREAVRSLQAALSAEREHARLFADVLNRLGQNSGTEYFVCRDCGYTVTQRPADKCPVCRESPRKFEPVS